MAADTALKRYSAMNISLPFRGLNLVPQPAVSGAERLAVMYYYSGVASNQPSSINSDVFFIGHHPHFGGHTSICHIG